MLDADGRVIENFEQYYEEYLKIWNAWADENPDLIQELAVKAQGKTLTDKFAKTDNNQARALAEIINKRFGKGNINDIRAEGNPIPMNFKVPKRGTPFANKDTNTMELILQGKRTSTTRTLDGYGQNAPEVGQVRLFTDKSGRKAMVRITKVELVDRDLFVNPDKEALAREIAKEGYTFEYYKERLANKVAKENYVRVEYELAGPNNVINDLKDVASMNALKDDFLEQVMPEATLDRLDPEMEVLVKELNSGGQEGIDFLGLQVADELGIPTGGVGMPGLTQRTKSGGRYDSNAGQLLKYNVEDSIDMAIEETKNQLAKLSEKILRNQAGGRYLDSPNMKKYLNESEQKRFYQLTRDREKLRAEGKELNNTDLNDYKALDIKRRGGLNNLEKEKMHRKLLMITLLLSKSKVVQILYWKELTN